MPKAYSPEQLIISPSPSIESLILYPNAILSAQNVCHLQERQRSLCCRRCGPIGEAACGNPSDQTLQPITCALQTATDYSGSNFLIAHGFRRCYFDFCGFASIKQKRTWFVSWSILLHKAHLYTVGRALQTKVT